MPILSAGLNEARSSAKGRSPVVPEDRFRAQLSQYFIVARATDSPAILVGPQWVDECKTQPVANLGFCVTNEHLEIYGDIMRQVAHKEGAIYVDLYGDFKDNGGIELLADDGCHPNALGHAAIHRQILASVQSTDFCNTL
jgi:lysophospholipase L1-like esterase